MLNVEPRQCFLLGFGQVMLLFKTMAITVLCCMAIITATSALTVVDRDPVLDARSNEADVYPRTNSSSRHQRSTSLYIS